MNTFRISFWLFIALSCCSINKSVIDLDFCVYKPKENSIPAYYINLPDRHDRRVAMTSMLNRMHLKHHRIEALTPDKVFIPPDVLQNHTYKTTCKYRTDWTPSDTRASHKFNSKSNHSLYLESLCTSEPVTSQEIGCVASHIMAMNRVCHDKVTHDKYALILEDDIFFPLDVDFKALIATAPMNFGILQVFSFHHKHTKDSWNLYKEKLNETDLWSTWTEAEAWSAAAYIINREVVCPVVSRIVTSRWALQGWRGLRLLAAGFSTDICTQPKECCEDGTNKFKFKFKFRFQSPQQAEHLQHDTATTDINSHSPCIPSHTVVADHFVFELSPTYTLRVPIAFLGDLSQKSNIIEHSNFRPLYHQSKFFLSELMDGSVRIPTFASRACNGTIPLPDGGKSVMAGIV